MLNTLTQLEKELGGLIKQADLWAGYKLVFKKNTVTFRTETHWRDCLIRLNRFLPVPGGDEYLHPHIWPGAIRVLSGGYEMDFAFGQPEGWGQTVPKSFAQLFLSPGSTYTMLDYRVWHAIRPKTETLSVCLCGPNFSEAIHPRMEPGEQYERERFTPELVKEHLARYESFY